MRLHQEKTVVLVLAGLTGLSGAAWAVKRLLKKNKDYDDLDSVVSFSSRLLAAMRAYESKEEDSLFKDPLAEVLSGKRGMEDVKLTLKEIDSSTEGGVNPEAGPHDSAAGTKTASLKRKYMVGRVALRTLFFDTHLLDAVTAGPPAAIKQVVLLGAGMDTRAWRLPLPEGVSWFEVDRSDVLKAKHKALKQAGAAFSEAGNEKGARHPLKAAAYISCSVDLENQNWADGLVARGFDPEVPTCWILEGLVMYLAPEAVEKLLKGMHAVSATGSRLLVMAFCGSDIKEWYTRTATSQPVPWVADLTANFKSWFPKDANSYLAEKGWQLKVGQNYQEMAEIYAEGRPWNTDLSLNGTSFTVDDYTKYIEAFAMKQ